MSPTAVSLPSVSPWPDVGQKPLDTAGSPISINLVPWSYTIDTDKGVVFTTGTGNLTDQETYSGVMKLYADPLFRSDLRGLFDYRGVETVKVSSEMMTKLADKRAYSENSRTAFLVKDALGFGLLRVYQSWIAKGFVKIYYDRAEAVAWLNEGVAPDKVIT